MEGRVKMGVLGQVWGIGKKRFGGDWERRMKLFDWLVGSVIAFGAEVWGWKEWGWEKIERIQRYIRCVENRWKNAGLHGERRKKKREDKDKIRKKGDGL